MHTHASTKTGPRKRKAHTCASAKPAPRTRNAHTCAFAKTRDAHTCASTKAGPRTRDTHTRASAKTDPRTRDAHTRASTRAVPRTRDTHLRACQDGHAAGNGGMHTREPGKTGTRRETERRTAHAFEEKLHARGTCRVDTRSGVFRGGRARRRAQCASERGSGRTMATSTR